MPSFNSHTYQNNILLLLQIILSAELEQEDESYVLLEPRYTHLNYYCTHTHSILPELQGVFGHLLESKLQYYSPENFWKKFKLWGQPVNVREQQDAFDFFCNLTDQVDERLKVTHIVETRVPPECYCK